MSDLLGEQKRYYAQRAPEYDDWWYRAGRYELEPDALARWRRTSPRRTRARVVRAAWSVLELAAGTGIWTRKLVRLADRVVAVDANAETLALNTADAELVVADVFEWRAGERSTSSSSPSGSRTCPRAVRRVLGARPVGARPAGAVFLVDSGAATAHTGTERRTGARRGRCPTGREFDIVKPRRGTCAPRSCGSARLDFHVRERRTSLRRWA
jgi:SAM-dependent methyltransferase